MKNKLLLLLLVFSSSLSAESASDELFALLEQESDLATKTKKNIDYLPGLITVIQQDEMKRLGFKHVEDALELIPGIDFSNKGLIVRGIGNAFISGKTKIMLNGVSFNDAATSAAPYILRLPVEIIERVEVIRGPGSALYGEYAFSGVINIVTVKDTDALFAGYEDFGHHHDGRQGGAAAAYTGKDLAMQLIVTDLSSDGRYTKVDSDILYQPQFSTNIPVSNAPGTVELLSNERFYLFDLKYKKFSFSAYASDVTEGEGFGEANALPVDDGEANVEIKRQVLEARQVIDITDFSRLKLKAGNLVTELGIQDFYLFPKGFYIYPDGIISGSQATEKRDYGGIELAVEPLAGHRLLFGAETSRSEITDIYIDNNINPATFAPLPAVQRFSGDEGPLGGYPTRNVTSFYAQDEWCLGEQTTVTMGLRYDDYDDIGANTSPRIAAVHELDPTNIVKLQYAHAFRPPNYMELYMTNNPFGGGDDTLKAETVDTYEAAYVFNNHEEIIRLGLFRSQIQNLIGMEMANSFYGVYSDLGDATVQGVEAEFEKRTFDETTIRAHLAYTDVYNKDDLINRYARITGSAGISTLIYHSFGAALFYRYTGERERENDDDRDALEAEHRIDLTLFDDHAGLKDFTLRAGVKNLLDAASAYPAPAGSYENDYPREGRNYWAKAEYRF